LTNTESKKLRRARQLIAKCKFYEAVKVLNDFKQNEGHSLEEMVTCDLLEGRILLQQGKYEDVIKLCERTHQFLTRGCPLNILKRMEKELI